MKNNNVSIIFNIILLIKSPNIIKPIIIAIINIQTAINKVNELGNNIKEKVIDKKYPFICVSS